MRTSFELCSFLIIFSQLVCSTISGHIPAPSHIVQQDVSDDFGFDYGSQVMYDDGSYSLPQYSVNHNQGGLAARHQNHLIDNTYYGHSAPLPISQVPLVNGFRPMYSQRSIQRYPVFKYAHPVYALNPHPFHDVDRKGTIPVYHSLYDQSTAKSLYENQPNMLNNIEQEQVLVPVLVSDHYPLK